MLVANRYTLNCNPDLPSFTLPEQMEGDVWSTFIYITPMTAANMSSKPEMTEKVLANIVYEASADGINWIQAINDNGKTVIKGLVANNQYTIRSRFGSIICTNSQQVTMESAEQLENGNFESVWNKKVHYIVITFQVGTREMKERPKVGKVPQAGEQESVMESGGAGVPVLFQQQTAAKTQML